MDKIASGIIDKLNIFGFFNVILSGGVLLYGLSPVMEHYAPDIFYVTLGLEKDIEKAVVLCVACYIVGCVLQCIQETLFKGLKKGVANRCLADASKIEDKVLGQSVLTNTYRRTGVTKLAEKLFAQKGLGEFDPEDKEMCSYFIDYCDYNNSIKGYGSKASRISESATFFEQMAVAFYTLTLIGFLIVAFTRTGGWIFCLGYLVMGGIFTGRAYQYRVDWAKAVLATYEASLDKEVSDSEATLNVKQK